MARMRVVAIHRGHDGQFVREEGEEFVIDSEDPRYKGCTWFAPVDKAPPPKVVDPSAPPVGAGPKKGSRVRPEDETGGLA